MYSYGGGAHTFSFHPLRVPMYKYHPKGVSGHSLSPPHPTDVYVVPFQGGGGHSPTPLRVPMDKYRPKGGGHSLPPYGCPCISTIPRGAFPLHPCGCPCISTIPRRGQVVYKVLDNQCYPYIRLWAQSPILPSLLHTLIFD